MVLDATSLDAVLKGVLAAHPEQAGVIRAFTPVLLARNRLVREAPLPQVPEGGALMTPLNLGALVVPADAAHTVALAVLAAMAEGLPGQDEACAAIGRCLEAEDSKALCAAWFADALASKEGGKGAKVEHSSEKAPESWAEARGLSAECLVFMLRQTCRILAARTVAALPEAASDGMQRHCPYCGSLPELSVIHGRDGRRSLVCGLCGRSWRFRRSMCPACGLEAPGKLRGVYVDGRPEERGVSCAACGRYVLEVDIRSLDLGPEDCQALMLGLGHLDLVLQEEGSLPLSQICGE